MLCKPVDNAPIGQPGGNKMTLSKKHKVREGAGDSLQHFRDLAAVLHIRSPNRQTKMYSLSVEPWERRYCSMKYKKGARAQSRVTMASHVPISLSGIISERSAPP